MRKHLLFLAILFVAFLSIGISGSVFAICTDSDANSTHSDGKNYSQKGELVYNGSTYVDYCYNLNPKYVLEWYCDSNGAKQYTWMLCDSGCVDGACKSSTGLSVNCGKLSDQITNDINYYGVVSCGNTNYKSANDVNGDKSVTAADILVAKSMTDAQCQTQLNNPKDVCSPACTPNWQPGAWSTCTNGMQARSYTDSSNCAVTTGKPTDETQICLTTESCKLKTRDGRAGVTYTDRNGNARDYYSVCYGGRYLLEYSCNTNNRYYSQFKYCAKGCSAGMCLGSSTSMSEPNDDLTQDSNKLAIEFLTDQVASIANAIANLISQIKK